LLGEYTERAAAQDQILLTAIAATIAILVLLQASFGNWRLATLAFVTLPFALVGGFLAAGVGGGILFLGSLVGLFTVLGIAAGNGIMLVSHYHHLEEHEGEPFGPGLVVRGAQERLRPILMTALATALAVSAGGPRQPARPRDRASNGRGHPRRPGYLDLAQPLRPPLAVPTFRQGERRAPKPCERPAAPPSTLINPSPLKANLTAFNALKVALRGLTHRLSALGRRTRNSAPSLESATQAHPP
jgi:hypothetical protein